MNLLAFEQAANSSGSNWQVARALNAARAPKRIVDVAHAGDLFTTVSDADGVASICAYSMPNMKDNWSKLRKHHEKVQLTCAPVSDQTDIVTLEVPPLPRLD